MYGFFLKLVEISLFTSAAVVLLLLFSRLFRKKTQPKLRYACWLVVALCFLIPVRPSLFTFSVPEDGYSAAVEYVGTFLRQDEATAPPTVNNDEQPVFQPENAAQTIEQPAPSMQGTAAQPVQPSTVKRTWDRTLVIPCVWILGMLISLTFYAVGYIRFVRGIRQTCVPVTESVLGDLLDDVRGGIGLKRRLGLAVSPVIHTPVVTGFFRPVIFIPSEPVEHEKLRLMLMHEALHIKSGHMWGKLLSLSVMVVHWFNPFVYLMSRAMLVETEMACDAAVLKYAGEEQRMQYGETVFQTAKHGWQSAPVLVSAFSGSGKNLKRRLSAIIERNTTRRWVAVICAVVMLSGLLLAGMVGCSENKDGIVDPIPQAEIDLTPTNELVIYVPNANFLHDDLQRAIMLYKKTYPDVNVTVETIEENANWNAYSTRVNNELMAGTGPDVVVTYFFPDIYKTADTGVFLNLSSIMEQDEAFHMEDYYQTVLDAGLYKGGRYFVPYSFSLPMLYGLQDSLDAAGFDLSKNTDFISMFEGLTACLPKLKENPSFRDLFSRYPYIYVNAIADSGLELVDYENKKVLPDEAALKAFCEAVKPYWYIDHREELFPSEYVSNSGNLMSMDEIKKGSCLFVYDEYVSHNVFQNISLAKQDGDSYVLSAVHSLDGGLNATMFSGLAIRAGSPNQLNAWNFIKTVISEPVQMGVYQYGPMMGCPINRSALQAIVERAFNVDFEPEGAIKEGNPNWIPDLTIKEKQPILDLFDNITSCSTTNYTIIDYFSKCMEPYFKDEKSYDECVAELKSKLTLYVSE